jgi:nucleotidyltransferase substrate binding protein (TIGR01987 family)
MKKSDMSPLPNAVRRLREGLARCEQEPLDEQLSDGLIHRFELAYELTHRMLRRYLSENVAPLERIDQRSFADLIRIGKAEGVVRGDWTVWRHFRDLRARSSHGYNGLVATAILAALPEFLEEAEHLCSELRNRMTVKRLPPPELAADHRCIVVEILHVHLPANAKVRLFGLHAASGTNADIGIAVDAGRPMALDEQAVLSEAFSASSLPYRVDIVDWTTLDQSFRETVAVQRLLLNSADEVEASGAVEIQLQSPLANGTGAAAAQ